jgi:threonine aldolase
MDGARLFNASIKSGESPDRIVENCDSVSLCLSKVCK